MMTSWQKGALVLGAVFIVCSIGLGSCHQYERALTIGYRAEWAEGRQYISDREVPFKLQKDLETMERRAGTSRGVEAAERMAAWYAEQHDWPRAAKAAEKAYSWTLEDSPKLPERARVLGLAYRRRGRADKAVRFYYGFLRWDSKAHKATCVAGALIETLSAIERYEEARREYTRLQRRYPELDRDLGALCGLRDAYIGLGEQGKLPALQRRIVALHPNSEAGRAAWVYLHQRGKGGSSVEGGRPTP